MAQDPISIIIRAINHDSGDLISPVVDCISILFSVYGRIASQNPTSDDLATLENLRLAEHLCLDLQSGIAQAIKAYENAESEEHIVQSINSKIIKKSYDLYSCSVYLKEFWNTNKTKFVEDDLIEGISIPDKDISYYAENLRGFFQKIDSIQKEIFGSVVNDVDISTEFKLAIIDISKKYPTVNVSVDGSFSSFFQINRGLIYLFFREIVSNAFKYRRDKKNVQIFVSEHVSDTTVCIEIRDSGLGMPEEDCREKIWLPLTRLKNSMHAEGHYVIPGQGNGLNIVKLIAENIGGTVSAESSLGNGTVLRLNIPLALLKKNAG